MSLSDIMKHQTIHPSVEPQPPGHTATFEVTNRPVVMRGFNIPCDAIGFVEMGYKDACGSWVFGPYSPECDQRVLTSCANVLAVGAPGFFRLVFKHRVTGEIFTDLDDVLVTATETTMPAEMLAKFGGTPMGCGSDVRITEANGCLTITVDGTSYNVCPGSTVACAVGGILIDGELCPFPEGVDVSLVEINDGRHILTVDGVAVEIGITTVSQDGNTYTATHPNGSTVSWTIPVVPLIPDVPEYTLVVSGGTYTLHKDGNSIGSWTIPTVPEASGTMTASIDTGTRTVTLTNPNGSEISFQYGSSFWAFDESTNEVTVTNPDGTTLTFPIITETPKVVDAAEADGVLTITLADESEVTHRQTRARLATIPGVPSEDRQLTLEHGGTWPDVNVYLPWIERLNAGVAVIHIYNHHAGEWEEVPVVTPEDVVILNNPVIYIRKDSGTANPPISEQADLTPANAFNSFAAVRTFMNRTLTVGTVTLDVRGNFDTPAGNIGPAQFKNAQTIIVRGDPADVTAFKLPVGKTGVGSTIGIEVTGGYVQLRDCTGRFYDEAVVPGTALLMRVAQGGGGEGAFAGRIRVEGSYNHDRANASASRFVQIENSGTFTVEDDTIFELEMAAGAKISNAFRVQAGGAWIHGGDVTYELINAPDYAASFLDVSAGATARSVFSIPNPPVMVGSGRSVGPVTVRLNPLAVAEISGAYGSREAVKAYDWGVDVSSGGAQAVMSIDAIGVLNNIAGP